MGQEAFVWQGAPGAALGGRCGGGSCLPSVGGFTGCFKHQGNFRLIPYHHCCIKTYPCIGFIVCPIGHNVAISIKYPIGARALSGPIPTGYVPIWPKETFKHGLNIS